VFERGLAPPLAGHSSLPREVPGDMAIFWKFGWQGETDDIYSHPTAQGRPRLSRKLYPTTSGAGGKNPPQFYSGHPKVVSAETN